MKLIATATLALAIDASPVVYEDYSDLPLYPIGPLPLSNARFADGEWNPVCGEPAKAIDGKNIGLPDHPVINKKELVHSKYQFENEFLVDLPERAVVTEVVFYPRNSVKWADHWARYAGLQVFVGDTPCKAQNKLGPQDVKASINTGLKWSCDYLEGASVSVKNNNWIHLMELTVDGYIVPLDPCENNGCLNGSTCVADEEEEKGYQCVCPVTVKGEIISNTGWDGEFCDNNIDECASNACVNGSCVDGIAAYTCVCNAGWDGEFCDNNIDDCASNECMYGSCVDGIAAYTCSCDTGYEGEFCDVYIDPDCASAECVYGSCVDVTAYDGIYACACDAGYVGAFCDIDVDECAIHGRRIQKLKKAWGILP